MPAHPTLPARPKVSGGCGLPLAAHEAVAGAGRVAVPARRTGSGGCGRRAIGDRIVGDFGVVSIE